MYMQSDTIWSFRIQMGMTLIRDLWHRGGGDRGPGGGAGGGGDRTCFRACVMLIDDCTEIRHQRA
jgi:hypothetical protein